MMRAFWMLAGMAALAILCIAVGNMFPVKHPPMLKLTVNTELEGPEVAVDPLPEAVEAPEPEMAEDVHEVMIVTDHTACSDLAMETEEPSPVMGLQSSVRYGGKAMRRTVLTRVREPRLEFTEESYEEMPENPFLTVLQAPLSTFSSDNDTASYTNVRRMLNDGQLPPPAAVRIEEFINYFHFDYAPPTDGKPFATRLAAITCPWNEEHLLLRVGIKGRVVEKEKRPPSNLVFLLDVSGSMEDENKLPLVIESMKMLVKELNAQDRVAIAVYAGSSGLVLPSTPCTEKQKILDVLGQLEAGGSTNGGEGIRLAYATAAGSFLKEGNNRVILCTDGDFNVGITNREELTEYIKKKAVEKVFLTVLGFGMGNLKDHTLEKLADCGNGSYGYIDNRKEAKKLFVEQLSGTLVTIAKDVKFQVEFNPAKVKAYRLIGYENRKLNNEDFNNDQKDAGEIGAGHTVTALYEMIPMGAGGQPQPGVDPLKYQKDGWLDRPVRSAEDKELLTVKLRYKEPDAEASQLLEFPFAGPVQSWKEADKDNRFAASVAGFAMLLKRSAHAGATSYPQVVNWAEGACGEDPGGYRAELVSLVRKAGSLSNN